MRDIGAISEPAVRVRDARAFGAETTLFPFYARSKALDVDFYDQLMVSRTEDDAFQR